MITDFTQLQDDLLQVLLSSDTLANVNIVSYYKLRLQEEINYSAVCLTPRNGRAGCGVVIEVPTFEVNSPNVTGPIGDIVHSLVVVEEPTMNHEPTNGTLLTAYQVAQILLDVLHQWSNGGSGQVYAAARAIADEPAFQPGLLALRVQVKQKEVRAQTPRCAQPIVSETTGFVTLACATPGATMYYTLDGTAPAPSNPGAQKYVAPFQTQSGQTIRYAAWAAGFNGSSWGYLQNP